MKFFIYNSDFKDAIERVATVVDKATYFTPSIKVWTKDADHITVTTDNFATFCDVTIPANVEELGEVYLDLDAIKKIYNVPGYVTVSMDGSKMKVRGEKKGCEVCTLNLYDNAFVHPEHNAETALSFTMGNDKLMFALERVIPAVTFSDSRKVLNGIYFDCANENIVALDGYRLHIVDVSTVENGAEFSNYTPFTVWGEKLVANLKKLIRKSDIDCRMEIRRNKNVATFHYFARDYDMVYGVSTIEGQYIEYKKILPQNFKHEFSALTSEIKAISKEYKGYKVDNGQIRFVFMNNRMFTYIEDDSFATFDKVESYNPLHSESEDIGIVFNVLYVLDGMNVFSGESAMFKWNNAINPILIEQDDLTVMILPIRADNIVSEDIKKFILQ